jgi:hypothetical protein
MYSFLITLKWRNGNFGLHQKLIVIVMLFLMLKLKLLLLISRNVFKAAFFLKVENYTNSCEKMSYPPPQYPGGYPPPGHPPPVCKLLLNPRFYKKKKWNIN